jgi:hypothetical protein
MGSNESGLNQELSTELEMMFLLKKEKKNI